MSGRSISPLTKKKKMAEVPTAPAEAVDELPIANSQLCFKSELALHKDPPVRQDCIRESEWIVTDPVTSLMSGDAQVVDFVLPISADGCYDLSNCRLKLEIKIVDKDGEDVKAYKVSRDARTGATTGPESSKSSSADNLSPSYDPVALVNNACASLWGKVEVGINDTLVASTNTNHHYRSFIQNTVNYSTEARKNMLAAAGYYPDLLLHPDSTKFSENGGMANRAVFTQNGSTYKLYGRLSHDLFCLTQVLPVGTKVAVRLHRNRDDLVLLVDPTDLYHKQKGYRVHIKKIQLETLRLRLTPETISVLERSLANSAAKYHFVRSEMRTFYVAPNSKSDFQNNLFVGQKPTRLFLGFVPVSAYQGSYTNNPLCFGPCNVSRLCLRVDNRVVGQAMDIDWNDKSGALYAYVVEFLKSLRIHNKAIEIDPTLEKYSQGPLTLFGWDLSKDLSDASATEPCGTVSLETQFAPRASDEGLVGVVLALFFGSMHIDKFGNVEVFDDFQK